MAERPAVARGSCRRVPGRGSPAFVAGCGRARTGLTAAPCTARPVLRGSSIFAVIAAIGAAGCGGESKSAPPSSGPATAGSAAPSSAASTAPAGPPPRTRASVAESLAPVSIAPTAHNLIKNATFEGGRSLPWMTSFTTPAGGDALVDGGALCLELTNAGKNAWDAQFRHREMVLEKGHRYAIRFKIASTSPTAVLAKIGMSGPPYKAYWQQAIELEGDPKAVSSEFTMNADDDATAEFAFHVGGKGVSRELPFDVCVDDVVLEDPQFTPKPAAAPPPIPDVLVNHVGYPTGLSKLAVLKSDATAPVAWQLLDRAGKAVAKGTTEVRGADPASGDPVHTADFSSFGAAGTGYTLHVGPAASHAFEIGDHVYRKLKVDALRYFYHSRSGVPIVMPFAGDPKWTRPAGHPADKSVPCAPDAHCDYSLDVSGGWYDAGDHGKYVVSGAIATWTLLDLYERTKLFGPRLGDFGDGSLNIPEGHNGVPDLLDEVRWELEFLMKMQVPEGKPNAGMAHHKIHDREWTALATRPDQDPIPRFLRPVSTAATLDLAAAAAQCARVWKGIDEAFAGRCLKSAERAWAAAVANPALLVTAADTVGGGPYEDDDVSDEFYWAAAELYLATKKDAYREFFAKSPHHLAVPAALKGGDVAAFTWQEVAALGTISLALAPGASAKEDQAAARAAVIAAADAFEKADRAEGYRVPFRPDPSGKYPWGSTSFLLDNAVVLGLAHDFTKDPKYLGPVEDAMSYLLGRNPLDQSYVTGYGFRPLEHPHHRFWAQQANAAFPPPPPGVLSGGPNSGLQDPYVRAAGLRGCPPMKCFADNIEAYSANEEAINWNAPLVWVAAYLDEHPKAPPAPAPAPPSAAAPTAPKSPPRP
ncbi:MAG: glycoside hydrolase family 9 protein [Myxococcales bacterium]|nr:glycoside hydrolase family 9 protein [Myxococcales bacterium]